MNNTVKKIFTLVMVLVITAGIIAGTGTIRANADKKEETNNMGYIVDPKMKAPGCTIKTINNGTGVKFTLKKAAKADYYEIYMYKRDNAYTPYLTWKGVYQKKYATIQENGKKRVFSIQGLPKGKYTFRICSVRKELRKDEKTGEKVERKIYSRYSEKSVTVKAAKKVNTKDRKYDFSDAKVGDIIEFGSYEQDDKFSNGKEPIEWIVLSREGDSLLVLSRYALDMLMYNSAFKSTTWEECTLRKWLNGTFYNTAFTKKEKAMVKTVTLTQHTNPTSKISGGNATKDNVFLLTAADVTNPEYGFSSDPFEEDMNRRCTPTAYAIANGSSHSFNAETGLQSADGEPVCWWLVRTPGLDKDRLSRVQANGKIDYIGYPGSIDDAIRPAIYIKIN